MKYAVPALLALVVLYSAAVQAEEVADRAPEQIPAGAKFVALEAFPAAVQLKHPYEYAQLLVTGVLESGERIDVTRLAQVAVP